MGDVSSAIPHDLANYARQLTAVDTHLLVTSASLAAVLAYFEHSCREPGFQVRVSHLPPQVRVHAQGALVVDPWVGLVGTGFLLADQGFLPAAWVLPLFVPPGVGLAARSTYFLGYQISLADNSPYRETARRIWERIQDWLPSWLRPKLNGHTEPGDKPESPEKTPQPGPPASTPSGATPVPGQEDNNGGSARPVGVNVDVELPYVDQTTYGGKYKGEGYGSSLCSAAALTMALKKVLGDNKVQYNDIADGLIDSNYLTKEKGLLSGDYLERYVEKNKDKYKASVRYMGDVRFNEDYLVGRLDKGDQIIVVVPGHYTLISGYRRNADGSVSFRMSDSFRKDWGAKSGNAALREEWITSSQLEALWDGGENTGRHTIVSVEDPDQPI